MLKKACNDSRAFSFNMSILLAATKMGFCCVSETGNVHIRNELTEQRKPEGMAALLHGIIVCSHQQHDDVRL